MSSHPEHVEKLKEIIADGRSFLRRCETLLTEMSRGTASADGPCTVCKGAGVVTMTNVYSGQSTNAPCTCPKGLPFRNAAAAMGRKQPHEELAPRFLQGDAPRASGRDRQIGERE